MEQLENKSFKDLITMTKDIADKFFFAKRMYDSNDACSFSSKFEDGYSYEHYLSRVQEAYDSLTESEQNLINNEFFYQSYHRWWEPLYSKATFYRYKKEAMQKFLGAFYGS